jgi:hypothetical protein
MKSPSTTGTIENVPKKLRELMLTLAATNAATLVFRRQARVLDFPEQLWANSYKYGERRLLVGTTHPA